MNIFSKYIYLIFQDALYDELLSSGCVYQERHGWERPGWFSYQPNVEAKPYDWYGAYGNNINTEDSYRRLLNLDYTFDYPEMHENVSQYLRLIINIINRIKNFNI